MGNMVRREKSKRLGAKPKPSYDLSEVKGLIREKKVNIRGNALNDARLAFGWTSEDILDALGSLRLKHFHKTTVLWGNRNIMLDVYKARGLKGENVYTHFYINSKKDELIINSLKEI